MSKTYKNNSSASVVIDGNTVAAEGSTTITSYVHLTDVALTADTDPTDLVLATGTLSKDTDGSEVITLNLEGADKVEVQVVSSAGKWELYFNSTVQYSGGYTSVGSF